MCQVMLTRRLLFCCCCCCSENNFRWSGESSLGFRWQLFTIYVGICRVVSGGWWLLSFGKHSKTTFPSDKLSERSECIPRKIKTARSLHVWDACCEGLKPLGKRSQLDPLPSRKQIIYPTRKGKGINNRLKHTFWLGYVSLVPQQKSHRAENKTGERRWISCGSLATQKRSLPRILVEKSIPNNVCFSQSLLQTQYQTPINYDAGSGFLGIILPGWSDLKI